MICWLGPPLIPWTAIMLWVHQPGMILLNYTHLSKVFLIWPWLDKIQTSKCLCVSEKGPEGSIVKLNATSARVVCSITYADTDNNPIPAISTLFVDGILTASETSPGFSYFGNKRRAELRLNMNYNSSSTYKCTQTFGQPTDIKDPSFATNAPTFNSNFTIEEWRVS